MEKLRDVCDVAGIVVSRNVPAAPPRHPLRRRVNAVAGRTMGRPFLAAWYGMQARYVERYGNAFPSAVPIVEVDNVNDAGTLAALDRWSPDLALVSGTNLLKPPIIEAMAGRTGILNLHTGLSPYVKGGPNCTNWCLAKGWFHLIGNTVMWLDEGIDTGTIVASERTPLAGNESLPELHWKVMEHAHDLYLRAVSSVACGTSGVVVPQHELGIGETFFNVDWSARWMLQARMNHRFGYRRQPEDLSEPLQLVELPVPQTPGVHPDEPGP